MHRAGDFLDSRRGLHADLGGFVRGSSHLIGTGGNLTSGITGGAHQLLQAMGHAHESIAKGVALGARNHFNRQVTFSNGHGDAGHLL